MSEESPLSSRTITIIALVQTFLVILGFLALGIVLKFEGYPQTPGIRWTPLAAFLRERGFIVLVVPVVWTLCAVAAERWDLKFMSPRIVLIAGHALAVTILGVFIYAAVFSYTRSILIHM